MTHERWTQIEQLYHRALDVEKNQRAAFLREECAGDSELEQEVERLLAEEDGVASFLEKPALEETARDLASDTGQSWIGRRVRTYEILSLLGVGGMGEVYRARDTKLKRDVAIKVLPASVAHDPDRLGRFEQEARALAALNHVNIGAIYGFEEADGRHALVLELIEGPTLADRLETRAIPVNETLGIARQIAEALEAAHEKGIVHRDLKPANIKITSVGMVKVLDFGLAKALVGETAGPDLSQAPTGTREGVILGTPAYMSPEQATGQTVDKKSDIWAFGCVLYEMLTRRRAFPGATVPHTIATVLSREPDWDALSESAPASIQRLLRRCLEKDSNRRLHDIADARIELEDVLSAPASPRTVGTQEGTRHSRALTLSLYMLTAILLVVVILGLVVLNRPTAAPARSPSMEDVTLTPLTTDPGYEGEPTFSPDGETIAYTSDRTGNFEIFLKQVSGGADINLTNNVSEDVQPAFSPDGRQIAFVSTRSGSDLLFSGPNVPPKGGDIWVIPALGGNARRIAESGNFPSWSPDGSEIIYVSGPWFGAKVYRIASRGGEPVEIPLRFKGGFIPAHLLYPSYSSDGRWILFATPDDIYVVSQQGGEPIPIGQGRNPVWSAASRTIIYSNAAVGKNLSLWHVPFDPAKGQLAGDPQPLTIGRGSDTQPAVTRDGKRIAFNAMNVSTFIEAQPFDAEAGRTIGTPQPLTKSKDLIYFFDISPEGRSALFESQRGNFTIWRAEPDSPLIQLTADPNFDDTKPRWSSDGGTIAFSRKRVGELQAAYSLWLMSSDGANPRQVVEKMGLNDLFTWMPDDRGLIHVGVDRQLYFLDIATKTERKLTSEPGVMPIVTISPDGSWVIYQCVVAGTVDLHAVPIGGGEVRTVVTTPAQDYHPFVSPSGNWLYYYPDHKDLYRVPGPNQKWRTAAPEKVTNFSLSAYRFFEEPRVSRNGRYLAYSRGQTTGDLWLMSLGK